MPFPKQAVVEELERTPIQEILGVVDAWGASIGRAGEQPWTVKIAFTRWKRLAGRLVSHQLALHKQFAAFEDAKQLRRLVQPYSVLRVRAHMMDSSFSNVSDGLLVDIVDKDESDEDLVGVAQQLREPVLLEDGRFGTLRLDRRMKGYRGSATWCSKPVQLCLKTTEDAEPNLALEAAHLLWGAEQEWNQRMCEFAALKLFDSSDHWRQSGDEAITEESFRKRLSLLEMIVFPNGKFECWFSADGMFTDHAVMIHGSLSEGPTSAGLDG